VKLISQYKDDLRSYYRKLKNPPSKDVLEFLEENSRRQAGILDSFSIDRLYVKEYDLPFKKLEFVNAISSLYIKGRIGRRLDLLVYYDDILLGVIQTASPVLNSKLNTYLKEKYQDFNFNLFNDKVYEISICIGTGMLTKYLTGKMLALIASSKEIADMFDKKYNTHIEMCFTTSIFGKSSVYNRLRNFKYLGLTEGYHSILTKEQIAEIKRKYKEKYPHRKISKSGMSSHLIRLYDHLMKDGVKLSFDIPKHKRGVYVIDPLYDMKDNLEYWYHRWFLPRRRRLQDG